MNRLLSSIAALWLTFAAPALAENLVVVELYTSQGCSSCPPADRMLHDLAGREDVIALALHVDYWDYIGWTDEFADPAHADRQRMYARALGRRSIFTPQMMVNGTDTIIGAKAMELATTISAHAQKPMPVGLSVSRSGGSLSVTAPAAAGRDEMVGRVLRYPPERAARITRGENAGNTFVYANVVEDWQAVARWDGRAPLALDLSINGDKPVVVLVQEGPVGAIGGAARLR